MVISNLRKSDVPPDWVYDSIVGFLLSPIWGTPVMTFIDTHCAVFDDEEENKLSYTVAHKEFKDLVEALLDTFITDIGITPEQFVQICQQTATPELQRVMDQVAATDDFMLFKRLMFDRNKQLDLEAVGQLYVQGKLGLADVPKSGYRDNEEEMRKAIEDSIKEKALLEQQHRSEEEDLARAIRESLELNKQQQSTTPPIPALEKPVAVDGQPLPSNGGKVRIVSGSTGWGVKSSKEAGSSHVKDDKEKWQAMQRESSEHQAQERKEVAEGALERLFARFQSSTPDSGAEWVKQERAKLLQQKIKERDQLLKDYTKPDV